MADCLDRTESRAIARDDFFSMHNKNSKLIDPSSLCIRTLGDAEICTEDCDEQSVSLIDSTTVDSKTIEDSTSQDSGHERLDDSILNKQSQPEVEITSGFFVLNNDCSVKNSVGHFQDNIDDSRGVNDIGEMLIYENTLVETSDCITFPLDGEIISSESKILNELDSNQKKNKVDNEEISSSNTECGSEDICSNDNSENHRSDSFDNTEVCQNQLKEVLVINNISDDSNSISELVLTQTNSHENSLSTESQEENANDEDSTDSSFVVSNVEVDISNNFESDKERTEDSVAVECISDNDCNNECSINSASSLDDNISTNKNLNETSNISLTEDSTESNEAEMKEVVIEDSNDNKEDNEEIIEITDESIEDTPRSETETVHELEVAPGNNQDLDVEIISKEESVEEVITSEEVLQTSKQTLTDKVAESEDKIKNETSHSLSGEKAKCLSEAEVSVSVIPKDAHDKESVILLDKESADFKPDLNISSNGIHDNEVVLNVNEKIEKTETNACEDSNAKILPQNELKCLIKLVSQQGGTTSTKDEVQVSKRENSRFDSDIKGKLQSLTGTVKIGCLSVTPLNPCVPKKDTSKDGLLESDRVNKDCAAVERSVKKDKSNSDRRQPISNVSAFIAESTKKLINNNVEITISPKPLDSNSSTASYPENTADTLKVKIPQLIDLCTGKTGNADKTRLEKQESNKDFVVNKNLKVIESFLMQKGYQREATILKEKTEMIKPYLEYIALNLEKSINEKAISNQSSSEIKDNCSSMEPSKFTNDYSSRSDLNYESSAEKELVSMTDKFLNSPAFNSKISKTYDEQMRYSKLGYYPAGSNNIPDKRWYDQYYGKSYYEGLENLSRKESSVSSSRMDTLPDVYRSSRYHPRDSNCYPTPEMAIYDQFLPEFDNKLHPSNLLGTGYSFRNSDFSLFVDAYTAEKYNNFIHFMVPESESLYFDLADCSKTENEITYPQAYSHLDYGPQINPYWTMNPNNYFNQPPSSVMSMSQSSLMPPYQKINPPLGHPLPVDSSRESCGQLTITPLDVTGKPYGPRSAVEPCSQTYPCNDGYPCGVTMLPPVAPLQPDSLSQQLTITPLQHSSNLPYLHRSSSLRRRGRPPMDPDYGNVGYRKDAYANQRFSRSDFMARVRNNTDIYPEGKPSFAHIRLTRTPGEVETKTSDLKVDVDVINKSNNQNLPSKTVPPLSISTADSSVKDCDSTLPPPISDPKPCDSVSEISPDVKIVKPPTVPLVTVSTTKQLIKIPVSITKSDTSSEAPSAVSDVKKSVVPSNVSLIVASVKPLAKALSPPAQSDDKSSRVSPGVSSGSVSPSVPTVKPPSKPSVESSSGANGYRKIELAPEAPKPSDTHSEVRKYAEIAKSSRIPLPPLVALPSKKVTKSPTFQMLRKQVKITSGAILTKLNQDSNKTPVMSAVLKADSSKLKVALSSSKDALKVLQVASPIKNNSLKVSCEEEKRIPGTIKTIPPINKPAAPEGSENICKITKIVELNKSDINDAKPVKITNLQISVDSPSADPAIKPSDVNNTVTDNSISDNQKLETVKKISPTRTKRRKRLFVQKKKRSNNAVSKNSCNIEKRIVDKMPRVLKVNSPVKVSVKSDKTIPHSNVIREQNYSKINRVSISKESEMASSESTGESPDKSADGIRRSGRKRKIIEGNPKFRDMERVDLKYFREDRAKPTPSKRKLDTRPVVKHESGLKKRLIVTESKGLNSKDMKLSSNNSVKQVKATSDHVSSFVSHSQHLKTVPKEDESKTQEKLQQFLDVNDIYLKPQTFV